MTTRILIALYLATVAAANLLVTWLGPSVVLVNAFVLIALDLTLKDRLQDTLTPARLGLLIAGGGLLSAALNLAALPVAVASCAAFVVSGAGDALLYARLRRRPWLVRANASNVPGALLDSVVFLALLSAFGLLPAALVLPLAAGQTAAKLAGGAVWSVALGRWRHAETA